jgi:hypothetical protein
VSDWRERHREIHVGAGEAGMRLGLVNDGRRELWFPQADFERWVELARDVVATRGDATPRWIEAYDHGTGPFLRRGLRLVMVPLEGRVLPELVPMVDARQAEIVHVLAEDGQVDIFDGTYANQLCADNVGGNAAFVVLSTLLNAFITLDGEQVCPDVVTPCCDLCVADAFDFATDPQACDSTCGGSCATQCCDLCPLVPASLCDAVCGVDCSAI